MKLVPVEPKPVAVGDLVVRARDGAEGVVTALGDESLPWWELIQPRRRDPSKILVKWLPLGPTTWILRAGEGTRWRRA